MEVINSAPFHGEETSSHRFINYK
jgi:4-aminobutyrate aminotransferase-like enzyme